MASITNLMNSTSSTGSLYGNRNVLSGLASGMDTESMIENSVKGYKTRIQNLIKQQTKLAWKQDAYRSITDKLISLKDKYTSYTSKTNLSSNAFFTNAVKQITSGKYAEKVAATGRTNSEVKINAVKQLATAAKYSVDAKKLMKSDTTNVAQGKAIDLDNTKVSRMSGDLTIAVGNKSVTLSFGEDEVYTSNDELLKAINTKLSEENIGGKAASDYITVEKNGDTFSFSAKTKAMGGQADVGDGVWFKGVSGDIESTLGIKAGTKIGNGASSFSTATNALYNEVDAATRLSNKTVEVSLDGVTKSIDLGDLSGLKGDALKDKLMENLSKGLKDAFGNKVTVDVKTTVTDVTDENGDPVYENDGVTPKKDIRHELSFTTNSANSTLKVSSSVGNTLGFGANGITNYLDVNSTSLKDLNGIFDGLDALEAKGEVKVGVPKNTGVDANGKHVMNVAGEGELPKWQQIDEHGKLMFDNDGKAVMGSGTVTLDIDRTMGVDADGNKVINVGGEGDNAKWRRVDDDGNLLYGLTINDKLLGTFTKDSGLDEVISAINTGEAGVKVSYSQMTNKFTFTATETGEAGRVDFGKGSNLATKLFGQPEEKARVGFTAGTDAIFNVTVNGENLTLSRSSNVVAMDGLSVTLKNTFNEDFTVDNRGVVSASKTDANGVTSRQVLSEDDVVTFTAKTDEDPIVDAVKSFVEEINDIMKSVHDAYTTAPLTQSNKKRYEPLTDEEKADLSESQIKTYEEKAQTGLLFGDSDLSRLYSSLRNVISSSGMDVGAMRDIGLTVSYENGVTTLNLNEDKLRDALKADPDKVRQVFTKTKEGGSDSDGLMANLTKTLNTYASTSIGNYGILVNRAGTKTKSLSLMSNDLQNQIDSLDKQIDKWQTKMSKQIDYYTRQFTALEKLMNTMNSQSSALSGMMGY